VQNRMLRAAVAIAAIGFVAGCAAPTPTALNGDAPDVAAPGSDTQKQATVATPEARQIVVEPGQSLSRIAAKYHMPRRAIIAANDLTPPYKIKIGQHLRIPDAGPPLPAPAVAGSPPPEIIALDRPALPGSTAPPPTAATESPPPPAAPDLKPLEVAASAGDKSTEAAVIPAPATTGSPPASSGSAEPPAPATTAAASVPAAPPPGVTCPTGTIGMWSERDVINLPVYICHNPRSQS
jgi:LysM repeat protein